MDHGWAAWEVAIWVGAVALRSRRLLKEQGRRKRRKRRNHKRKLITISS